MKIILILFTFILSFTFQLPVQAYPHFVGFGYTSCITCHYNPFGNGPLNDYGRALSATAISAKWNHHDKYSEEKLAQSSGFFLKVPKQQWFRPSLDYRGLFIKRSLGQKNEDNELIHMQGDANITLRLNEARNIILSASIGYAPTPLAQEENEEVKNYRTREHYIGYRPNPKIGMYLGLMDKIYGVRIAEHTTFGRAINDISHNDQSHGLQVHYARENFELGLGYYLGNFVQEEDLRSKGFSLKADYVVSHKSSIGISVLKTANNYVEKLATAVHTITAVGKGSSILFELGQNTTTPENLNKETEKSNYGFLQSYVNLTRGVFLLQSIDYLKNPNNEEYLRFGPGIQIFPMQRIEIRGELYNTKNFSDVSSTKDSWDMLLQLHTWF